MALDSDRRKKETDGNRQGLDEAVLFPLRSLSSVFSSWPPPVGLPPPGPFPFSSTPNPRLHRHGIGRRKRASERELKGRVGEEGIGCLSIICLVQAWFGKGDGWISLQGKQALRRRFHCSIGSGIRDRSSYGKRDEQDGTDHEVRMALEGKTSGGESGQGTQQKITFHQMRRGCSEAEMTPGGPVWWRASALVRMASIGFEEEISTTVSSHLEITF